MNYVTTNIRLTEEDYLHLKAEAAKKRKSLSSIIRDKLSLKDSNDMSPEILMRETEKLAKRLGKKLKGFNSVKALREMRYERK